MDGRTTQPRLDLLPAALASEVEVHIQCQLGGRVRHFRLEVADRGVILRGYCRTYYAKQLAQHAVMEATELPILANEIEVS